METPKRTRKRKAEVAPKVFDEAAYLRANQDVEAAIKVGLFESGLQHYQQYGLGEGRAFGPEADQSIFSTPEERPAQIAPASPVLQEAVSRAPPVIPSPPAVAVEPIPSSLEGVMLSHSGAVFIVGWIDDTTSKLGRLTLRWRNGVAITIPAEHIARVRRRDVEGALGSTRPHAYGFWAFIATGQTLPAYECEVGLHLDNTAHQLSMSQPRSMDNAELLNVMLGYLHGADYFGNKQMDGIATLERGLGRAIVRFHKFITGAICSAPYVETFNKTNRKLKGSIIVCLYGRSEYMFVQSALFSGLPGIQDYEFVYVCNSPELSEKLLKETRITSRIYGIEQTVVLLPGNAGFGAANNLAVRYAHSNRVLIVNPDVFPYDQDWAKKHTDLVASLPSAQTTLFGVPLYYEDGSLMHGGMYMELDPAVVFDGRAFGRKLLARVEHYGKGAPPGSLRYRTARPVPAVTGAFMSIERNWFERLGGFTEDFVFGHYEDADLCLKSFSEGVPVWLHDIKLWHLEGKGSTRQPFHEGGSLVNRWLFSHTWGEQIMREGLNGPHPTNPIFKVEEKTVPVGVAPKQINPPIRNEAPAAKPAEKSTKAKKAKSGQAS